MIGGVVENAELLGRRRAKPTGEFTEYLQGSHSSPFTKGANKAKIPSPKDPRGPAVKVADIQQLLEAVVAGGSQLYGFAFVLDPELPSIIVPVASDEGHRGTW